MRSAPATHGSCASGWGASTRARRYSGACPSGACGTIVGRRGQGRPLGLATGTLSGRAEGGAGGRRASGRARGPRHLLLVGPPPGSGDGADEASQHHADPVRRQGRRITRFLRSPDSEVGDWEELVTGGPRENLASLCASDHAHARCFKDPGGEKGSVRVPRAGREGRREHLFPFPAGLTQWDTLRRPSHPEDTRVRLTGT